MDRQTIETLRKHGAKARRARRGQRVTTSLTFEAGSQSYTWITGRDACRLARR